MSAPLQETRFSYDDIPDQTGRTVLVTGANGGLGLQTARTLAHNGARVLMACRNPQKAQEAVAEVTAWARGPEPESIPLDLADLSSVRTAADRAGELTDSLDVLVNNAGLMAVPLGRTADGFEMQLGTNYLGHVALTDALLPLLLAAPAPRVVNEASVALPVGIAISLEDPNYEHVAATGSGARTGSRSWPACCSPSSSPGARPAARCSPSRRTPAWPRPTCSSTWSPRCPAREQGGRARAPRWCSTAPRTVR